MSITSTSVVESQLWYQSSSPWDRVVGMPYKEDNPNVVGPAEPWGLEPSTTVRLASWMSLHLQTCSKAPWYSPIKHSSTPGSLSVRSDAQCCNNRASGQLTDCKAAGITLYSGYISIPAAFRYHDFHILQDFLYSSDSSVCLLRECFGWGFSSLKSVHPLLSTQVMVIKFLA